MARVLNVHVLSPGGDKYVGFARKKARILNATRERLGMPAIEKVFQDSGFSIKIRCDGLTDRIQITGGAAKDTILLSSDAAIWGYNHISNTFAKKARVGGELYQTSPTRLDFTGTGLQATGGKVSTYEGIPLASASMIPSHNIGAFIFENTLSTYKNGYADLLILDSAVTWDSVFFKLSEIGLIGYRQDMWNLASGPEAWRVDPNSPLGADVYWRWTPHIWYPDRNNSQGLQAALYYGQYVGSVYGPASEIKAHFGCIMEPRGGNAEGYCEVLSEVDGEVINRGFFYSSLWEAPRDFSLAFDIGTFDTKFTQHTYSESTIKPEFTIEYADLFTDQSSKVNIYWWGGQGTVQGIVSYNAIGEYAIHRRTGFIRQIKVGEGYIDHTVSSDGNLVAIMTGSGGIVTAIWVYDIAADAELRSSTKPQVGQATNGEFIPTQIAAAGEILPYEAPPAPFLATVRDSYLFTGSLGGMLFPFPPNEGATVSGWKLSIDSDGEARGFLWKDTCWENAKFYRFVESEELPAQETLPKLIYYNPDTDNTALNEYAIADFSSEGYPVEPTGAVPEGYELYERDDTLIVVQEATFGCLELSKNASPPFVWSGDFEDADGCILFKPSPSCAPPEVSVVDACGLTASITGAVSTECCAVIPEFTSTPDPDNSDYVLLKDGVLPYFVESGEFGDIFYNRTWWTQDEDTRLNVFRGCGDDEFRMDSCFTIINIEYYPVKSGGDISINQVSPDTWRASQTIYDRNGNPTGINTSGFAWLSCAELTSNPDGTVTITSTDECCAVTNLLTAEGICGSRASVNLFTIDPLEVTGPIDIEVGSDYSSSGGKGVKTYTLSCGEINSTGLVTDLTGCCGTGFIIVEDECGNTAALEVRFPVGTWVTKNDETWGTFPACFGTYDVTLGPYYEIVGGTRYVWRLCATFRSCILSGPGTCATCADVPPSAAGTPHSCSACSTPYCSLDDLAVPWVSGSSEDYNRLYVKQKTTQEWSCP